MAFAVILGACESGGPSRTVADSGTTSTSFPETDTTEGAEPGDLLEVIEEGVSALYTGDAERAVELFELPDMTDEEIRQEAGFQAAIQGRLTLSCSEHATPGTFTCNMPYHNALTDAVGIVDRGDTNRVTVTDGVITEFSFPEHSGLMVPLASFIGGLENNEACEHQELLVLPHTTDCANLVMEHLEEFARSYQASN